MRIATIGAGPGGLYASLLLKKAAPSSDITIFEKNPEGATYGWGVVFSDRTLASFSEADNKTYRRIIEEFVIWDAIDIRYRDSVVRAGGQVFSGISRKRLLAILTERCRELGVGVRFSAEVHPGELTGYDLVIAADGVHSLTRGLHSDSFRPRVVEGRAHYIWFGTTCPLDSFTFAFRDGEHGLFQAHAYPYDGSTSTFIVECDERAWRAAELDVATTDESIAYCEKLFAEDLRGHGLMSNQSRWSTFPTLTCKSWHHDNVVLLGDAAHTAHFSIGSGTKLAMEDAIALSAALEAHRQVDRALVDYELARKPVVERFQEAARQSQTYFESTRRFTRLDPEQFVVHLLTRSGRVDYAALRVRDPHLIEHVERWFASGGRAESTVVAPPPALTPLTVGGVELPNRVVVEVGPTDHGDDGLPGEDYAGLLAEAARSGAGLVLTSEVAVSAHGRITPGCPGMWSEGHSRWWDERLPKDRVVGMRLNHAGRRGAAERRHLGLDRPLRKGAWTTLAASPIPYGINRTPAEMTPDVGADVRDDFVSAARNARAAGFGVLILEMGRGFLLGSFLSPLTNFRTDRYGGTGENRRRFPLEVFDAVRAAWDGPLGAAVCADDWARGGAGIDDAVELVDELTRRGCALVEVSAGHTVPSFRPRLDPNYLTALCEEIRNRCGIATLIGGAITTVDRVNTLVAGARADLCVLHPRR